MDKETENGQDILTAETRAGLKDLSKAFLRLHKFCSTQRKRNTKRKTAHYERQRLFSARH
jgi:hypothetical protein